MANLDSTINKLKAYYQDKKILWQRSGLVGKVLPLVALALAVVAIVVGVFGYKIGERQGRYSAATITLDYKGRPITTEEVQNMRLENDILKNEMAMLIQERDISLNNLNLIRGDMQQLRKDYEEVKSLNEALSATAAANGELVQVVDMQVDALEDDVYEYRFDVLIASVDNKILVPSLTLLNATSMVEIPLKPSSYNSKGLVSIRGKFAMPEGFSPSQLRLGLSIDGERVTKLYNWRVNRSNP